MAQANAQLKQARQSLGLSQLQLAMRAGVSSRTVQFAESGQNVSTGTMRRIAGALGMQADQLVRIDPGTGQDGFAELPWSVADKFRTNRNFDEGSMCRNEADVVDVVRQLRENFSVQIQKWGTTQDQQQALQKNSAIDEVYFRYEQRYVDLWRRNPGCIRLDRFEDTVGGVSIVLPLTAESFHAFRDGKLAWLDISADDLADQSQYLLLDSVTEFTKQCRRPWYQVTKSLSLITFNQVASLAESPNQSDFEMVSFSASPLNERRLGTIGFIPEPTKEPEFSYPIYWFGEDPRILGKEEYSSWATFKHFAMLIKSVDKAGLRRRMIRNLLSMVKRLQRPAEHSFSRQAA
ncbi:helix-turn-helix domain-containing protein [Rhodopirellula europaea]|jgi:transcriptional regulator with XRE-family HTH domain|uniref:helix-turn-helix domain-containing protein n=1 Tax=Rhodopirellula europaea TaxID=1263866 RepID=UPI003D280A69|nr:helix-turn-helix domain-containing protein [bacterium]|tara:strand:- start:11673 stop:12716 length:1044 start_codon:yes stop_codon:yes gene_type:complete